MLRRRDKSATLVEAVIYVGVFGIVIVAVFNAIYYSYRSHSFVFEQISATRESRFALEQMVKDIREAAYADNGAYPIISMSDYEFEFYSDVDDDNKIEKVKYFLDAGLLKRSVTDSSGTPPEYGGDAQTKTIAQNIKNQSESKALFEYYDKSGAKMNDLSQILDLSFVFIRVVSDINPNRSPGAYEFISSATLRNLVNAYVE